MTFPARRRLLVAATALAAALPATAAATWSAPWDVLEDVAGLPTAAEAPGPTSIDHLVAILDRSPGPEYRRFGSPGMASVADYLSDRLTEAGYLVERPVDHHDRWAVDYSAALAPLLRRDDGREFVVESGFAHGGTDVDLSTGPHGVSCMVVAHTKAGPGQCGLVPFGEANPEWNNFTAISTSAALAAAAERGAAGMIFAGVPERQMIFAQQTRTSIPVVSAAVAPDDVMGREVVLRVNGRWESAPVHNVVGVLPEPTPGAGYVALTAHADGWFAAAVDNGGGTAAALDAAEALAVRHRAGSLGVGVLVLLVDAEEVGLVGSRLIAERLTSSGGLTVAGVTVRMDEVLADVNLDAPSAKPSDVHGHRHAVTSPLAASGVPVFSWRALVFSDPGAESLTPPGVEVGALADTVGLSARMVATFGRHGVFGLPAPSTPWQSVAGGWRTDAQHFHEAGVPVVWPVAGYPEYHTNLDTFDPSGDTYSTVEPSDLQSLADAAVDWVVNQEPATAAS